MRFILGFLILWMTVFSLACANEYIDLDVSSETVSMGERVQLNISVNASEIILDAVQFEIPGIEAFDVFSQSQSESYSNINGAVQRSILYSLDIAPNTPGEFTLGPVILTTTSEIITDDETIVLQVGDILSNPQSSNNLVPDNEENPVQKIEESQETDIKGLRIPGLSPWMVITGIIIFILLFYILLLSVLRLLARQEGFVAPIEVIDDDTINEQYRKYFKDLKKQVGTLSSKDIFRRYNSGIRKILVSSGYPSAETDTLKQLSQKKDIGNQEVFDLFQKSYKYEYSDKDVTPDTQKKYIDDILQILQ